MAKHVIEGKVRNWDHKIFTIQKTGASEKDILIHFGRRVDYKVVKLDVKDLPSKDKDNEKINWFSNFGVMDSSGRYLKRVNYTVFLPRMKNARFVYYERGRVKSDKTPKGEGKRPRRTRMVQVDFNTGDPGVGCK